MCSSELSRSQEYLSFRSSVSLRKIVVDADGSKGWKVYDSSPKTIKCPLVCLPPVSGTADVFFKQILGLAAKGYRIIAASIASIEYVHTIRFVKYVTFVSGRTAGVLECQGMVRRVQKTFGLHGTRQGASIRCFIRSERGFLAQKFTEVNAHCPRVVSLVLCNTFTDTSVFSYNDSAAVFWILPSLVLKKMLMGNFVTEKVDGEIVEAIDFMVERLESLTQPELASRLTMNCVNCYVQPQKVCHLPITIVDVFDEYALSNSVREEVYKCYPNAKLAHLKSGGNFPYLSRAAEVNLHLQIHLRQFEGTEYAASERTKL